MNDRTLIVMALIIGGAIVAASYSLRARFVLSAADSNIAWRMDTWSGQIDICAAAYTQKGPVVRCGAYTIQPPAPKTGTPDPQAAPATPQAPGNTGGDSLGGKPL